MTPGKTIAFTTWTFVGKVTSLLFNTLSRLVTTFLPRSTDLLISWLESPSAMILEPKKVKSVTVPTVSPSIFHEVMGPDAMIFVFWMLRFKPTSGASGKKKKEKKKKSTCQCRRCESHGFDPGIGKIPWRRAWQPTPVFLPGESHGQRSLEGYST